MHVRNNCQDTLHVLISLYKLIPADSSRCYLVFSDMFTFLNNQVFIHNESW